jgi:hypothetical protein
MDAKQRNSAMTRQTLKLRPRYAPMYAVAIIALLALTATGSTWTRADNRSPAIDVSAMMNAIDVGSLPVQGHIDAF